MDFCTAAARAKAKAKKDAEKAAAEKTLAGTGSVVPSPAPASLDKDMAKEGGDAMEVEGAGVATVNKKEVEAIYEKLSNPARVVPAQERYVKFPEDSRYKPVKKVPAGIVLLKDRRLGEPEELVSSDSPGTAAAGNGNSAAAADAPLPPAAPEEDDKEPPPPEPFEYIPS